MRNCAAGSQFTGGSDVLPEMLLVLFCINIEYFNRKLRPAASILPFIACCIDKQALFSYTPRQKENSGHKWE